MCRLHDVLIRDLKAVEGAREFRIAVDRRHAALETIEDKRLMNSSYSSV
jgi:hypothetical protein